MTDWLERARREIRVIQPARRNVTPWGQAMSSYRDYINQVKFRNLEDPEYAPLVEAYRTAHGRSPAGTDIGHARWGLLYENLTLADVAKGWQDQAAANRPPAGPSPGGRLGTEIPVRELRGHWLYVEPFWSPARVFASDESEFRRIIDSCKWYGNICVSVVNFLGTDQYSPTFRGSQNLNHVVARLDKINRAGLANVVFAMGNDYLRKDLGFPDRGGWSDRLNYEISTIGQAIAPYTQIYIPLTERGKTLTSAYNRERRAMYTEARYGMGDRGWIGAHELPGEPPCFDGVYFEDLKDAGDCMPCIQTGFDRSETAIRRCVSEDSRRWRDLRDRGNFSGDTLYCAFEHSIPMIDPRWPHSHTLDEAERRGRAALNGGADLDFSGGQTK